MQYFLNYKAIRFIRATFAGNEGILHKAKQKQELKKEERDGRGHAFIMQEIALSNRVGVGGGATQEQDSFVSLITNEWTSNQSHMEGSCMC